MLERNKWRVGGGQLPILIILSGFAPARATQAFPENSKWMLHLAVFISKAE